MKNWFFILFSFISICSQAQLRWQDPNVVQDQYKEEPKPILIFIHTDWCKICEMQENSVFADDCLSAVLNDKFYSIKINAESKEELSFFGRKYKGASANTYHELANYYGESRKKINFPTVLILNDKLIPLFRKTAFVSKEEFEQLMLRMKW